MKQLRLVNWLSGIVLLLALIAGSLLPARAQNAGSGSWQLSGQVQTSDKQPAIGAAVLIKGTMHGVVVDIDGNFTISVSNGDVLEVSLIGYATQTIPVGKQSKITVVLQEDALSLEETVVVAYGAQSKATITGAVNSVRGEDVLRSPTANITNSLAGTMTGLTSVQRSGEPGKDAATFKIRGIGTLNAGNESAPLIIIDGVERDSMEMLDPNEVESVNILKDASATAVYGVRGANGVIIVTTRQGEAGQAKVTFSSNFGWQSYTMMPQLVDAADWITLYNEGIDNEGVAKEKYPESAFIAYRDGTDPVTYSQTDWVKALLKKSAPQQQYNINVSGGTEDVKYFVMFGMLHQEGMYRDYDLEGIDFSINPDYKRYNFRANIDAKLVKGLTLSLRLGTTFTNGNYANYSTASIFSDILNSTPFGPNILDGKLITGYGGNDPIVGIRKNNSNLYTLYENGYQLDNTSKYNLSAELKYDLGFITKGLGVHGKVAYDDIGNYTMKYTPGTIPSYKIILGDEYENGYTLVKANDESATAQAQSYGTRYKNLYLEAGIDYARSFGNHHVTALALYNQRTQDNPAFEYKLPKALLGFVGRVTYDYDHRYLAEVDLGYNGSENFAEGRRFGFFPAFSLGWILTQESFFPKNNIVTYAKIRGSYGEVGNDQIGGKRFLYLPTKYDYPKNGYNFGTYGVDVQYYKASNEGDVGNPLVTWERARKANIGIDLKMLRSRLSFTGDLFSEYRDNILWEYGTVPSIVGSTPAPANLGKVSNRGFEAELAWNDRLGEFNYFLKGVFSFARNRIEYMDEPEMAYKYLMKTGYSVGQYKGWLNEGFINTVEDLENQPQHSWGAGRWDRGELNFIDINGDGVVDANDKIPIGYSDYPEITYGFSFGFNWKGLEFNALLQGATNVTLYMKQEAVCPLYYSRSAQTWHMGRWTEERYLAGENITYPRMLSDNINSPSFINPDPLSTFWLYDASYLRLRNVELAYNIRLAKLREVGISDVRLSLSGTNLLTFSGMTNFDPESPSGKGTFYPMPKVYNFGVKVIF
ncbi:MAG: TonB-dependent receptor [Bacteroidales bacterium]|nr:TonB-dependent receptor [Bacteroidales bacterium]